MTSPPRRLVSVGNVVVDVAARVDTLPERGGDVLARSAQVSVGGAYNTLVAAVRQGLPAAYAGALGTGLFGDLARAALQEQGIEVLLPPVEGTDTGFTIALVEADGERRFVTAPGAEARLSGAELDRVRLRPGDLVHVSGYGLLPQTNAGVLAGWVSRLPAEHLVLVDPGPLVGDIAAEVLEAVLRRADWLSVNLREAQLLTGEQQPEPAAAALAERARGVVVRCGADGCLLIRGAGAGAAPAGSVPGGSAQLSESQHALACRESDTTAVPAPAVTAVDTSGAGDAHVGAFLAALADGQDPVSAARRANACAAIAVTRYGSATAATLAESRRLS